MRWEGKYCYNGSAEREGEGGIGQFSYRKGIGHSVKSERMGDFSAYTKQT